MLEGKELEGKFGDKGGYSVDVDGYGVVRAELSYGDQGFQGGAFVELEIIDLLKMLAQKSENQMDDKAVEFIEKLIPKKPEDGTAE